MDERVIADELCTYPRNNYLEGIDSLVKFPSDTGITGQVFQEDSYYIGYKGKNEPGFHEIDHVELHREIKNFLFVTTHGFKGQKNGVLQFYSRKNSPSCESELTRLEPYRNWVGMMLEILLGMDKSANVELNIKKILKLVEEAAEYNQKKMSGFSSSIEGIHRVICNLQKLINANAEYRKFRHSFNKF